MPSFYAITLDENKKENVTPRNNGKVSTKALAGTGYKILSENDWGLVKNRYNVEIKLEGLCQINILFNKIKGIYGDVTDNFTSLLSEVLLNKYRDSNIFKENFDIYRIDSQTGQKIVESNADERFRLIEILQNEINKNREKKEQESYASHTENKAKKKKDLPRNPHEDDKSSDAKKIKEKKEKPKVKGRKNKDYKKEVIDKAIEKRKDTEQNLVLGDNEKFLEIKSLDFKIEEFKSEIVYVMIVKKKRKLNLTGIRNIGNTCYMNSVLQCLMSCTNFIEHLKYVSIDDLLSDEKHFSVSFKNLVIEYMTKEEIYCYDFKSELEKKNNIFYGSREQDSVECLETILDVLDNELPKIIQKKDSNENGNNMMNNYYEESIYMDSISLLDDENETSGNDEIFITRKGDQTIEKCVRVVGNTKYEGEKDSGTILHKEEFNNKKEEKNAKEYVNIIRDQFYGIFKKQSTCLKCNEKYNSKETFSIINLPLPMNAISVIILNDISNEKRRKENCIFHEYVSNSHNINTLEIYLKKKYGYESLLMLEISQNGIPIREISIDMLESEKKQNNLENLLQKKKNHIVVYKYIKDRKYIWIRIYYKKYYLLREKFLFDFLVENQMNFRFDGSEVEDYTLFVYNYFKGLINIDYARFSEICDIRTGKDSIYEFNSIDLIIEKDVIGLENIKRMEVVKLEDCVSMFSQDIINYRCEKCSEVIRKKNMEDPEKQKKKVLKTEKEDINTDHLMEMSIDIPPPILMFQLKRFGYDGRKLSTYVEFPDYLKVDGHVYRLLCFCNHIEIGFGSGHYTAMVRRRENWYLCNDESVVNVRSVNRTNGYLLFYELL